MLSKFFRRFHALTNRLRLIIPAVKGESAFEYRRQSRGYQYVPPFQYDAPLPKHMGNLRTLFAKHWELTPILATCLVAYGAAIFMFYWSAIHKVDVQFQRDGLPIYGSMNMCRPTVHKMVTLNQEYKPWPELAAVLANMENAERKNSTL